MYSYHVPLEGIKLLLMFFIFLGPRNGDIDFCKRSREFRRFVYGYGMVCRLIMSRHMGIPTICICENKDADQLRGNREADQRLCFRYSDSIIPLLLKSEISSL